MPRFCGITYEDLLPYTVKIAADGDVITTINLQGLILIYAGPRLRDGAAREEIEEAMAKMET